MALRALASVGEPEVLEEVSAYLDNPEPPVKKGAIVGLLYSGGIGGVLAAGYSLLQLASSQEPEERLLAAQVLGDAGIAGFHRPLVPLLRDEDYHVQRAALRAAGRLKNPKLWPHVLDCLGVDRLHRVRRSPDHLRGVRRRLPIARHYV